MSGNLDSTPFDWDHLNQNSINTIVQMCILLQIQIDTETMSKKELITKLSQYPKMMSTTNCVPNFVNSSRFLNLKYPKLQEAHSSPIHKKSGDNFSLKSSDEASNSNNESTNTNNSSQCLSKDDLLFQTEMSLHGSLFSHFWRYILRKKLQSKKDFFSTMFFIYVIIVFIAIGYFIFGSSNVDVEN
ncbi:hypothetical protein TVAG_341310 [Trichomonas vaginalis G3]|uniref:Uncharacterized protein n=1 Tax=Trichomonas vaginalis (strain ATCC PRA-98 / G3) TaxID=412133 RepID=A2DTU0_TRIV3|nr:hypothetical protein TVAGG3_1036770 [Trichomonas vaginalis G3]EAY16237.1 hypothetical protein TVAG_341310 [Trichomonas vaginalis G3]KAI5493258.1 hypothetical protein TVAGG3_1036770 [Trichomonas vaginalis G3]|eukprot:XP_001328460.1 hypothetical protein [Trichomonas vaginalis G3]